jgi:hypothetical protein
MNDSAEEKNFELVKIITEPLFMKENFGNVKKWKCLYETNKVKTTLYYNHTKGQFFLLKNYLSGKNHIDFFLNFDNIEPGLFFDQPGIFKVKVAFSVGFEQKLLSFDFSKNVYIVQSENNGKEYNSYYQKVRK